MKTFVSSFEYWLKLPLTFLFWLFEHIRCTLPQVNSFGCWHFMGLAYHRLLRSTLGSRICNNYTCWQWHCVLPCRAPTVEEAKKNCMYLYVQLLKNIVLTKSLLLWGISPQLIDERQDNFTRSFIQKYNGVSAGCSCQKSVLQCLAENCNRY